MSEKGGLVELVKRRLLVITIMYRKDIRKKLLKIIVLLNFALFIMMFWNNQPSMIIFMLNVYYINNYLKSEYPEEKLKNRDRYELN